MSSAEIVGHFFKCLMGFEAQRLLIWGQRFFSKIYAADRCVISDYAPESFEETMTAFNAAV